MHCCVVDVQRLFAGWSHAYVPPALHCTFHNAGRATEAVLGRTLEEGMVLDLLQAVIPNAVCRLLDEQTGNQVAWCLREVFWKLVIQICNPLHDEVLTLVPAYVNPESFQTCGSPQTHQVGTQRDPRTHVGGLRFCISLVQQENRQPKHGRMANAQKPCILPMALAAIDCQPLAS